jgi:hypothetical protein
MEAKLRQVKAALAALRPTTFPSERAVESGLVVADFPPIDPVALTGEDERLRLELEAEERDLEASLKALG